MYVSLPGITNGQSIELLHTIDNSDGQLDVAICDVTYYPRWTNINAARGNNEMFILGGKDDIRIIIPDEVFKPNGISLTQNESNGILKLATGEKDVWIFMNLSVILGFARRIITIYKSTFDGVKLPDLVPYKELCIHLDQISTTGNIQLESPSTLLRSISVQNE